MAIIVCGFIAPDLVRLPNLNGKFLRNVVLALIVGLAFGFAVQKGAHYLDPAQPTDGILDMLPYPVMLASHVIRLCILAPIEEEFIYRGVVMKFAGSLPIWGLAAITLLPWSFDHVTTGGLWQVTIALIAGLGYFWIRHKSGHFGYSAISHGVFNAIQIWP